MRRHPVPLLTGNIPDSDQISGLSLPPDIAGEKPSHPHCPILSLDMDQHRLFWLEEIIEDLAASFLAEPQKIPGLVAEAAD